MPTPKSKKHSMIQFGKNFGRFCIIESIILSVNSWSEYRDELKKYFKEHKDTSLEEYKFFNLFILIENSLCCLLDKYYIDNYFENNQDIVNKIISGIIKANNRIENKISKEEAEKIFKKESGGEKGGVCTPHMLSYVAEFTLGGLISFLKDIKKPLQDKNLIDKLEEFKDYRNDFTHKMLSTRLDYETVLNRGISLGMEIKERIDELSRGAESDYLSSE